MYIYKRFFVCMRFKMYKNQAKHWTKKCKINIHKWCLRSKFRYSCRNSLNIFARFPYYCHKSIACWNHNLMMVSDDDYDIIDFCLSPKLSTSKNSLLTKIYFGSWDLKLSFNFSIVSDFNQDFPEGFCSSEKLELQSVLRIEPQSVAVHHFGVLKQRITNLFSVIVIHYTICNWWIYVISAM